MKTKLLLLLFALTATLGLNAQQRVVLGQVIAAKDRQPIELANVLLVQLPDSNLVSGAVTDSLGRFALTAEKAGNYLIKTGYVGLQSLDKTLTIAPESDTIRMQAFALEGNDVALRSAVVRTTAARVEQREDTTVFNASAFRVPEGSTLEALIKQLPGAEVSDDGTIKVNGKTVKEFLVNGKDFFKGDTKVAMKNLPTNIVSRVKTYDKKSDYAEQTGIDDGEESFVLDIGTKRELNQSLVSNIDLGNGWDYDDKYLYSGKIFASRFTDRSRVTVFGSRNNVGDAGFGGPRGMGGGFGGNGITTSTMGGLDFSWENGLKKFTAGRFEVGGSIFYNRNDNESESTTASETFLTSAAAKSSFSNARSWGNNLRQSINARLRLKWSPDSLTNLSFRPNYSWSQSNSSSTSRSATFDENPFDKYLVDDTDAVLAQAFRNIASGGTITTADTFLVNLNDRTSLGRSFSHNVDGNLEITRRLPSKAGRNVSFQARAGYNTSESFSYSKADIYTRSATNAGVTTLSPNGTHQFSQNDSKSWNYRLGLSYVEPIVGKLYAEFRYNYEHRFNDSNRSLYDLHSLNGYNTLGDFLAAHTEYSSIGNVYQPGASSLIAWQDPAQLLSQLNINDLQAAIRDDQNSQYATYNYDIHDAQVRMRYNTDKINFSAGVSFNPERTRLEYERPMIGLIDTVRTVFNVSPQIRFRYNFSKTDRLNIFYRGSSSSPSMTNLLNVIDNSDPLNISVGNPGLKPTWNDMFRAFYNGYNAERQQGIMANLNFSQTRNSISNLLVYDSESGRRFTRPENISGNWSAGAGFTFNTPLDREKLLIFSTSTNVNHNRNVAYVSTNVGNLTTSGTPTLQQVNDIFAAAKAEKNINNTTNYSENLDLSYRRSLWDVSLNGRVNYQHSRSSLQTASNLDTWSFAYGASGNLNLDNGLSISTDIRMNSRRGFSAASMNTNELLWNAQISKSFLANKALSVSLRFYDILQQQSNISRNITALMRTDSWNNAINSYVMLHVIYKLNIFAGSKGAKNPENNSERPGPGNPQGRPGYGSGRPPMGGGPGGRPGGMF